MLCCMTRQPQKKLQALDFVAGLCSSPHFTACCDADGVCSATMLAILSPRAISPGVRLPPARPATYLQKDAHRGC